MTPLHQVCLEKIGRAQLHLVDRSGTLLSAHVRSACESAYRWVIRDYPDFDQAQIANWAEELGAAMELRSTAISSPKRYAYVALGGKVRDWLRTGAGRVELKGMGAELDYFGRQSENFIAQLERNLLFEQLKATLSERDRAILVLLLRDKSTAEIATFLNMSYAAAAKATQRVKDRISATLSGKRHKNEPEREALIFKD